MLQGVCNSRCAKTEIVRIPELPCLPAQLTETEDSGCDLPDDALLWYAQALWAARWFGLCCVLLGLAAGAVAAWREPGLRTVALVRGENPAVGYMHRNYWDGVSRTIQSQLKVAAEAFRPAVDIAVKSEADPWLVRIELRHVTTGEGRRVIEQLTAQLPCMARPASVTDTQPAGTVPTDRQPGVEREIQLIEAMDQLQRQVSVMWPEWDQVMQAPVQDSLTHAQPNRVFFNEGMLRLPFEDVPHAERFRRLTRAVGQVSLRSGTATATQSNESWRQLTGLQQQVTRLFLLHWAAHDVFSAAADSHSVVIDSVHEASEPPVRYWLKYLFAGGTVSLGVVFVLVVPWYWLRQNWNRITAAGD